jgi:hypothetical protein
MLNDNNSSSQKIALSNLLQHFWAYLIDNKGRELNTYTYLDEPDTLPFINALFSEPSPRPEPKGEEQWPGFYCQRHLEDRSNCDSQCDHCKTYYAPIEQQEGVKTAEQILDAKGLVYTIEIGKFVEARVEHVIAAMEEYASQNGKQ